MLPEVYNTFRIRGTSGTGPNKGSKKVNKKVGNKGRKQSDGVRMTYEWMTSKIPA